MGPETSVLHHHGDITEEVLLPLLLQTAQHVGAVYRRLEGKRRRPATVQRHVQSRLRDTQEDITAAPSDLLDNYLDIHTHTHLTPNYTNFKTIYMIYIYISNIMEWDLHVFMCSIYVLYIEAVTQHMVTYKTSLIWIKIRCTTCTTTLQY